jgi:hypothetical protein
MTTGLANQRVEFTRYRAKLTRGVRPDNDD